MESLKIKDMAGNPVEVKNLDAAIQWCKFCMNSPYRTSQGYTVGEDHEFMLGQLQILKRQQQPEIPHIKRAGA